MARQTPDLETAASRAHTLVRCYDSEAPVEYEQRVVAFLDVLGWGSAVSSSETDSELRRHLLNAAWALAAHVQNYAESDTAEHPSRDEYSQFSDSLVVSFPYEAPNDLLRLVRLVSEFQTSLLLSGFLLRGGVTVGSLFHSREIVFGPAMNRAYALEHEVAVHPRVVIDPALDAPLRAAKALLPPHWPFIVRSGDGPHETDFLTIFSRSPAMTAQLDHKIDQWLAMHQASPNVLAKYQWLSARWDCAKRGRDIEAGRAAPPTSPVEG